MQPAEFTAKLKANPRPVIVDLWAPWCTPCRMMEPAFQQIVQKYMGQVDIWKINADESPEVLRSLKVMSIPTTVGFAQGREVIRKTGRQSVESLDILFDAVLHQRTAVIFPPAPIDRWLRSIIGLLVITGGWSMTHSLLLPVIGAAVLFSAFYDRCPIFRALAPRVVALIKKQSEPSPDEKPLA